MNFAACRFCGPLVFAFFLLAVGQAALAQEAHPAAPAAAPNLLVNAGFECGEEGYTEAPVPPGDDEPNYFPNGWIVTSPITIPVVTSTLVRKGDSCDSNAEFEKMEGRDSLLVSAIDLEKPPEPGKPFDVTLMQQVPVVSGTDYSLSGWMLTLCGGSFSDPNDCPEGYYMAKLLGIDPTGGTDPAAPTVEWVENRRNFVEPDGRTRVGWQNLRTASTAQALTVTVFARINSPFRWHGNHGFIDALSIMQAPTATITATAGLISPAPAPPTITVAWQGSLGPDIPLIPNGNHRLLYDLEYWNSDSADWQPLASGSEGDGSLDFVARCFDITYQFRVKPRAEQPEGNNGATPNQRYPGLWVESAPIVVPPNLPEPSDPFTATNQIFMPVISTVRSC